MTTRRDFIKMSGATAAGLVLSSKFGYMRVLAATLADDLSDPALQPKFAYPVPDALAPGFIYKPGRRGDYKVKIAKAKQATGLIDPVTGKALKTWVWGYGDPKDGLYTWPGRTFQIKSVSAGGPATTAVNWDNGLKPVSEHLLPVDTSLHWCYSLPGYTQYNIANNGMPIITHLHGGHTDYQFDGNPEFFYGPGGIKHRVVGPQWANVPGGFTKDFVYDNDVRAGNLWYHDHALGITRLNVYAGLAGFYFVRDEFDTGEADNPLSLPAWPYEKAYAIQDRMFLATGELFYPAYPGDPAYEDFITGEGVTLSPPEFPDNPRNVPGFIGGGPTALAEFFGDHMVVNGVIWPYENVEPRNYRMHLLNGTDSRFMAIRFREVALEAEALSESDPIVPFWVIGSDQGLASSATSTDMLLSEPGSRYDIVFDFKGLQGQRIIMENIGGDEPFGGDIPGPEVFECTNRIMAFNVADVSDVSDDFNGDTFATSYSGVPGPKDRIRKVALFEGKDEFGRLQPLLGTTEPATDYDGNDIDWPDELVYSSVGLSGPMEGSIAWHSPTTENPVLNSTEEWEVWNVTGDAHPVHLHLVHFETLGRQAIKWDSNTIGPEDPSGEDEDRVIPNALFSTPAVDGTYLVTQPTVQHNSVAGDMSTYGLGFKIMNPTKVSEDLLDQPDGYVENTPKDMVTALPEQVTLIRAKFDKLGRYVWHCHILSHEDHEMMRVLHVGPNA